MKTVTMLTLIFAFLVALTSAEDDSNPLQALVAQQAAELSEAKAQIAALTARVQANENTINKNGQKQAAFHVRFSGDYQHVVHVGDQSVVRFDSAVTNVGNAYNTLTGVFTATWAGTYLFLLDATHLPAPTKSSQLSITKTGGRNLASTYGKAASMTSDTVGYTSDTTQAVTHLNQGEQVWVKHQYGAVAFRASGFTTFTGALLQAD